MAPSNTSERFILKDELLYIKVEVFVSADPNYEAYLDLIYRNNEALYRPNSNIP